MDLLKNLKNITIIVLIGLIVVSQFRSCTPDWPWNKTSPDTIKVKSDTTYIKVKEEVQTYVPKWRTKIKIKTDTVKIERFKNVDTIAIITDYYSAYRYSDTIRLSYVDSLGKRYYFGNAVLIDTISQNKITGKGILWNYKIPIITRTITIQTPPRRQLYVGAGTAFNRTNFVDNVSGGLIYKTKQDKIYQFSLGLGNRGGAISPFLGAGIYWKIKLKK
jgi:hypothetical protein